MVNQAYKLCDSALGKLGIDHDYDEPALHIIAHASEAVREVKRLLLRIVSALPPRPSGATAEPEPVAWAVFNEHGTLVNQAVGETRSGAIRLYTGSDGVEHLWSLYEQRGYSVIPLFRAVSSGDK